MTEKKKLKKTLNYPVVVFKHMDRINEFLTKESLNWPRTLILHNSLRAWESDVVKAYEPGKIKDTALTKKDLEAINKLNEEIDALRTNVNNREKLIDKLLKKKDELSLLTNKLGLFSQYGEDASSMDYRPDDND